jgi:hypothetical protein
MQEESTMENTMRFWQCHQINAGTQAARMGGVWDMEGDDVSL